MIDSDLNRTLPDNGEQPDETNPAQNNTLEVTGGYPAANPNNGYSYPYVGQNMNSLYNYPGLGMNYGNSGLPPTPPPPANKAKKSSLWGWIVGAVVLVAFIATLTVLTLTGNLGNSGKSATIVSSTPAVATTVAVSPAPTKVAAGVVQGQDLTPREVSERVRPAVVQITSQVAVNTTSPVGGFGNDSSGLEQTGIGSGVIYDQTGYILTNFHVVEGASKLLVTLPDGRAFDATVVGQDRQTDLAVVKIDPKGDTLPIAELGNSSSLQVGDSLVAIGNALGLPGGPTVTTGVVSALDRSIQEPGSSSGNPVAGTNVAGPQLYGLIQTDAPINPGNSGGALVDMQGRVIGINTLVAGGSSANGYQAQGIGFAISINQAKDIATQLVKDGKAIHPFMGISFQPLTAALAKQFNLDASIKNGAVLGQVQSNTPAANAGLKKGDVIVSIDGQKLNTESALGKYINQHKPGDKVKLEVITPGGNNQSRSVEVTLTERPNQ